MFGIGMYALWQTHRGRRHEPGTGDPSVSFEPI
jgi:hypothetical protein